jgi:cytochrome c biogenesis protein CcdA
LTATLWLTIVGIAALDSVNPTVTAVHLFLLGTARPLPRAGAFVLGVYAANYLGGLLAIMGVGALVRQLPGDVSGLIDTGARLILGLALLIAGYYLYRRAKTELEVRRPKSLRPLHTLILGVAITCAELPTALPYLAAIAILAEAGLGLAETAGVLLAYNLVLVSPLLILLGLYLILRRKRAFWLARIGPLVSRWFPRLLPILLGLLGMILIVDGMMDWLDQSFSQGNSV